MNRCAILICLTLASCGFPLRSDPLPATTEELAPIVGFEDVRAVDGYPNPAFQAAFDETVAKFVETEVPADGRRDFPMLVLSSGGVNGAFGAGLLTAWTRSPEGRPKFWTITGVSVGALMAPFVFAGPEFDDELEILFRRISPGSMHREKGLLSSVLWDESLMDNSPLRRSIRRAVDMELIEAVAREHEAGRRLMVGSTNLDSGAFVVWDLGAIATRRNEEALDLFREVLRASASIPVVYPPTLFETESGRELHADGAVVRPLFIPQNVFDGYASAEKVGMSWDDVDATLYVIHNGSLRPAAVSVQRDTIGIAMRTVTMMSYTMVSEHILHLYMLSRAWGAKFQFFTMPNGSELSVESFTEEDTDRLFRMGQGMVEDGCPWLDAPPGYVTRDDLNRIAPDAGPTGAAGDLAQRMDRLEATLEAILQEMRAQNRGGR